MLKDILLTNGDPICYSSSGRGEGKVESRMSSNKKAHTLTKGGYGTRSFSGVVESLNHTDKALKYMNRKVKDGRTHWDFGYAHSLEKNKGQCLTANIHKGIPYNILVDSEPSTGKKKKNPKIFRKLHPIECERLQTVPDNFTEGVSNTQRYRMLGNGWTIDVIAHILKNTDFHRVIKRKKKIKKKLLKRY
jgi:site-specific DNA-cytosine methylase